jgi:hypothetical protein
LSALRDLQADSNRKEPNIVGAVPDPILILGHDGEAIGGPKIHIFKQYTELHAKEACHDSQHHKCYSDQPQTLDAVGLINLRVIITKFPQRGTVYCLSYLTSSNSW